MMSPFLGVVVSPDIDPRKVMVSRFAGNGG